MVEKRKHPAIAAYPHLTLYERHGEEWEQAGPLFWGVSLGGVSIFRTVTSLEKWGYRKSVSWTDLLEVPEIPDGDLVDEVKRRLKTIHEFSLWCAREDSMASFSAVFHLED